MPDFSSSSTFRNTKLFFSRFISQLPELLAEVRSGSNSGEQLLPVRASSAESKSTAAFFSSRASSRCIRFVDRTSESPSINSFLLGSVKVTFPVSPLHCVQPSSTFSSPLRFPLALQPHGPAQWRSSRMAGRSAPWP
jgi:hypothetical protein